MPQAQAGTIFDSSVLSAFAVVGRLDLLAGRYSGRATWAIEVQVEIVQGLATAPALSAVLGAVWLGEPVHSFAVDEIERVRLALGGTSRDRRHSGEAASIVIAGTTGLAVAVDDRDATLLARTRGIGTIGTVPILQACVRSGAVTAEAAYRLIAEMRVQHGRRLPAVTIGDFRQ